MENKIRKENTKESNPFWNCVCARVRATGKYIKVYNKNAFQPMLVPEWVQIGSNGMELAYFKHEELEFG